MNDAFVYGEIGPDNLIQVPWLPDAERAAPVLSDSDHPGGAASNVAILLAHWGLRVFLSGNALGEDHFGKLMLAFLKQYERIDLTYLMVAHGVKTPFCRIMIPPNGDRVVLFYHANQAPTVALRAEMLAGCRLCILDDNGGNERLIAAQAAQQVGVPIVCGDVYRLDHPLLPFANVIVNSAHLIASKLPGLDLDAHLRALQAISGARMITSHGAQPVQVLDADGHAFQVEPPSDIQVVDATGAGDALKAGVCYGLLTSHNLPGAVRLGVAAGALVVQRTGAVTCPPLLTEVIELSKGVRIIDDSPKR